MAVRNLTEVICTSLDGKTKKKFMLVELKELVEGNLGIGRVFMLDGEVWRIKEKIAPPLVNPTTDGNYKHTRYEYRMSFKRGRK